MYRIYCYLDGYPYYYHRSGHWTMWSWSATLLTLGEAKLLTDGDSSLFYKKT